MTYSQLGVIATRLATNIGMLAHLCPEKYKEARAKLVREISEDITAIQNLK